MVVPAGAAGPLQLVMRLSRKGLLCVDSINKLKSYQYQFKVCINILYNYTCGT